MSSNNDKDSQPSRTNNNNNEGDLNNANTNTHPTRGSSSTTTRRVVHTSSTMSVQSTHSSSVSIHSTAQTTTTTTTVAAADSTEDILSIENTLEQVAAAASQNNTATTANTARTRAGFNSISDAIGNLRTRLNRHTSSSSSSSNTNATGGAGSHHHGSMLQRLQHRLHTIDAAHSSRIPLHVMESRSRRNVSVPNISFGTNNNAATTIAEGEEKSASSMDEDNNANNENTTTPPPPLHVSATIFSIDTRETTHYEESTTSTTSSTTTRPTLQQHRRSSVLFASRIIANRSIMEGTSNILLASGGTHGQRTSRRDLLGDRGLSVTGSSLRDFEMHVHPSVSRRMLLSPISGGSSEHSGSETTVTTTADAKDDGLLVDEEEESMDVELSDMEVEEEGKEVVPDTKNKLYSWGKGIQSLHDDSNDRIIPTLNDDSSDSENNNKKNINTELLVVTSRLDSKSILSVSTSQHSSACATSLGTVYVAGRNVHGCVDPSAKDNEVISRPMLLDCLGNIKVVQVSCGYDHTAVLSSNGSVVSILLFGVLMSCFAATCVNFVFPCFCRVFLTIY